MKKIDRWEIDKLFVDLPVSLKFGTNAMYSASAMCTRRQVIES